jgi:tetratricopeptide (TPR) repeat protein
MEAAAHKPLVSRRPLISAMLVVLAVLGFVVVSRLVSLYHSHQKVLAQRIYQQGLAEQRAGKYEHAIEDFRAALIYDPDNDQIQLNLARALRDTGRLNEAESYLLTLWERTPQDSAINLALGRLATRRGNIEDALRYYHNAIYGVWKSDPESNRRMARFELIEFLLQQNALAEAQSELIALLPSLPGDPLLRLRVADQFARAQDYSHALAQYQAVLQREHSNAAALLGAGQAAFQLGRYRTAHNYLQAAVNASPPQPQAKALLQTANLILGSDPFRRGISDAERNRRIRGAFNQAGERLDQCALSRGVDLSGTPASSGLAALKSQWLAMKPKLAHMSRQVESDLPDAIMDLVFQIEQQTQKECGSPEGLDQALLLISRDRAGVDR